MNQTTGGSNFFLSVRKTLDSIVFFVRTHPKGVLIALGIIVGFILMLQNTHMVKVRFFFWTFKFPMVVWTLFFGGMGYLAGKGIEWARQKHLKRRRRALDRGDKP